jgi:hypothetical protein
MYKPVVLLITLLVLISAKTRITPFGERPEECVIQVPSGATVTPGNGNELLIRVPATETSAELLYSYPAPDICSQDIEEIHRRKIKKQKTPQETNGWLDNVGWYPPSGQNNLKSFTSTYTVPQDPVNNNGPQVLFYFIGMQDNDAPSAVNIVQPVLTWGNGYHQWYVESWACCPKNITVSSPPLFGLQPGSTLQGVISRESDSTWKIDSIFNGKHTTLNAQVGDYIYNWADITLEVYHINNCPDFARGKMTFNSLVLTDAQGQTLNPNWAGTGTTLCGGSISSNGPGSYVIQHTQA